jgi:hydroxymethylpyrimidine pyrophosphatase-like HAD family hydrolase
MQFLAAARLTRFQLYGIQPPMRYLVLATDYDGTLASQGKVREDIIESLKLLRASGRKVMLVTGRHMPDLITVFPRLELFDRIVVENGALLYRPETKEEKLLCEPPDERFVKLLRDRGVPVAVGRGIVATWEPHQDTVLQSIHELGLDLQVIFNKGAVMVLPSGVNKATGLEAALRDLGLSAHNVVGLGDAENDHSFLAKCECSVAVANALDTLKDRADIVTRGSHGDGVKEIAEQLLADDLAEYDSRLGRHAISLGLRCDEKDDSKKPVLINPYRNSILVAGPSASGKSTAVSGILEQLEERQYQFCLLDPEGDFENFAGALNLGTAKERPDPASVLRVLESPDRSVTVNLIDVPVGDRPGYCAALIPKIQDLRSRTARPHFLIFDEAHHLLPSTSSASSAAPQLWDATILITVHPDHVSPDALYAVSIVLVTGKDPMQTLGVFAKAVGTPAPEGEEIELQTGEALIWFCRKKDAPIRVRTVPGKAERRRHLRRYAEGGMSEEQSFYFRGPESKLNLRAQNLNGFLQLAEGVDDETWLYHLKRGDYTQWFREIIKDEPLAQDAAKVEADDGLSAKDSRGKIKEAIETRYTAAV